MAKSKARRVRSRKGAQTKTNSNYPRRVSRPRTRLPQAFKALDSVIESAKKCFVAIDPAGPYEHFQGELFNRAFNGLKSIRLLVELSYWESAVGVARQLFEMSLNIEQIILGEEDPEVAALRFVQFGLLQQALRLLSLQSHFAHAPRLDGEAEMFNFDKSAEEEFAQFIKGRRKDGSIRWMENWCDMSVRKMVEISTHPKRRQQYELLYRSWSKQVHGSPGALMMRVFMDGDDMDLVSKIEQEEDKRIAETIANSINIFCEIWMLLPETRNLMDEKAVRKWLDEAISTPLVHPI